MAPPVNLLKLGQKVSAIREAIEKLAPFAGLDLQDYLSDEKGVAASKYYLLVATEAAIDICNHLVARLAKRVPNSYAGCFEVLAEKRVISGLLTEKLARIAKLRNLLVHQYGDIDNQKVHLIIRNDLTDLDHYLNEVAALLKTKYRPEGDLGREWPRKDKSG